MFANDPVHDPLRAQSSLGMCLGSVHYVQAPGVGEGPGHLRKPILHFSPGQPGEDPNIVLSQVLPGFYTLVPDGRCDACGFKCAAGRARVYVSWLVALLLKPQTETDSLPATCLSQSVIGSAGPLCIGVPYALGMSD